MLKSLRIPSRPWGTNAVRWACGFCCRPGPRFPLCCFFWGLEERDGLPLELRPVAALQLIWTHYLYWKIARKLTYGVFFLIYMLYFKINLFLGIASWMRIIQPLSNSVLKSWPNESKTSYSNPCCLYEFHREKKMSWKRKCQDTLAIFFESSKKPKHIVQAAPSVAGKC